MEHIESILDNLKSLVCSDRAKTHGDIQPQFGTTAKYWSIYLGVEIQDYQVARMMQLSKISRETHGQYNPDDFEDNNGYGVIAQALREQKPKESKSVINCADYACKQCQKTFAQITDSLIVKPPCPFCGSQHTKRLGTVE